jgi:hypothetical protein
MYIEEKLESIILIGETLRFIHIHIGGNPRSLGIDANRRIANRGDEETQPKVKAGRRRHHHNRGENVVEEEANLRDKTYVESRSSIRERFRTRSQREPKEKEI